MAPRASFAVLCSLWVGGANAACSSEVDCNVAGDCTNGVCVCDAPWTGDQCTHLNFEKGPRASGLQDASKKETWGASIMQENASSFHMFASYFLNSDLGAWQTHSVVTHAWSPNVTGPYEIQTEQLIGPSGVKSQWDASNCHNPTIHKVGSEYVLFYIGMDYTSTPYAGGDPRQTIGAAYSTSLWGPWTRMNKPLLEPAVPAVAWERGGVSNPAVLVNKDGSVAMYYRGNNDRGVGVTSAPEWRGPYTRRNNNESIIPAPASTGREDLYVWRNVRGGCHMLLHQELQGDKVGGHLFTQDPECIVNWTLAQPAPSDAYDLTVSWDDGNSSTFTRRERPQPIFLDGQSTPSYLSSAVESSCLFGQRSCSIVVPLATGKSGTMLV